MAWHRLHKFGIAYFPSSKMVSARNAPSRWMCSSTLGMDSIFASYLMCSEGPVNGILARFGQRRQVIVSADKKGKFAFCMPGCADFLLPVVRDPD